jgi:nucleoid DNA-binding protein
MVGTIIREYFDAGHKKVTVPGFGTFMRKDSGEVIFVDLIRKDDGLLRELVEDYGNYSEVEAMALVDRFIFEVKHGIERSGSAPIDDFGTMFLDEKGLYQFDYSPKATPVPARETAVQESLFGNEKQNIPHSEKPIPQEPIGRTRPAPQKPFAQPRPAVQKPVPTVRHVQHPRPSTPKSSKEKAAGVDKWIVIAIVAAVVALAIIIYGLSGSGMPFLQ